MATTTQFKLKLTGILLFLFPVIAFSQSLSGVITDSLTREPVGYASVSLYNSVQNDKPVTGTISDSTGFFRLEKISGGDYILCINCMGYYRKEISISVTGRDNIDLKDIELKLDENVLDEITVTGEQRTITLKPDKKIIAIDNTMASSGESLADILKILPEIRVVNDVITLKNQSFSVYINGKPAGISGQQLVQIPASTAEKIEVMTNPSVKYSPDGLGGIVNIITKKRIAGINGVVQAAARTDNYYGGAFMLNYGAEKFNLFATLFPSYFNTNIDGYSNTVMPGTGVSEETMAQHTDFLHNNFKLGFDLDITKNDLLTLYWSQNSGKGNSTNKVVSISTKPNPPETSTINTNSSDDHSFDRNALSLNYKHIFARKGTELSFDFIQSFGGSHANKEYIITDENKMPVIAPYRKSENPDNNSSDITIDFTTVLSEKINLNMNAGFNLVLNRDKESRSGEISINGLWKDSASLRNSFRMNEYIPSVYLLFDFNIKKFEFRTGVRTEYYRRKLNFGNQENNAYNIYPNFAVSYSVNDNNSLNMSYTRRIYRPYIGQLNPVSSETDYVSSMYVGNENLKPVFSNSFEFGYAFNKNTWGINTSLAYMDTKNNIDLVYYNIGDVRYKREENIADVKTLMFDGGLNWKYKALSLYLMGSVYNTGYRKKLHESEEKSNHWSYDIRFVPQLRLKNNYNFNMQAIYYGTQYSAYSKNTESFSVSLNASKTIKKLTFTLRALNLFRKIFQTYSWNETYTNELFFNNNDTAIFQAGILYKFGNEKRRIRARTDLNRNPVQLNR
jgi:outer membrane receptor protein involved in Fe transport